MTRPGDVRQFDAVDQAPCVTYLMHFLDEAKRVPGFREAKDEMLAELRLEPGVRVMDAGCGMGTDAMDMAGRVAPDGTVVGVDRSSAMIEEARRRAGAGAPVEWRVADVLALPFAGGEFDACRMETVLQHVREPAAALAELARVTRPGGRVVCFEFDAGSSMIDSLQRGITRTILTSLEEAVVQGWMGRQLPRLFAEAGLTGLRVLPRTLLCSFAFWHLLLDRHVDGLRESGVLTADQIQRWWAELATADAAGVFTGGITAFLVSGTRR